MTLRRTLGVLALFGLPCVGSVLCAHESSASACGGLYVGEHPEFIPATPQNVPSVKEFPLPPVSDANLVVFDESRGVEHLIREVRFDRGSKSVAFLVPVPAKPALAAADAATFSNLGLLAPYEKELPGEQPEKPAGTAANLDTSAWEVSRVGSFTVTHLSASETAKVDAWLKENEVNDTPALREWMAHYAALGFHYAAFHYKSPGDEWSTGVTTENVRLTFATKVPYLPYREVRPDVPSGDERRSDLWVVSKHGLRPIASKSAWSGDLALESPYLEGARRAITPQALTVASGDLVTLEPGEKLTVQTFRDRKSDRRGFGDVVLSPDVPGTHVELASERFVGDPFPRSVKSLDLAWANERAWALPLLDPKLQSMPPAKQDVLPTLMASTGGGNTQEGAPWRVLGASAGAALALLVAGAVRRRHVRIGAIGCASLFVLGCAVTMGDPGLTSATTPPPAREPYDDDRRTLFAMLDGHHDVSVDALEPFSRAAYHAALRHRIPDVRKCYAPMFGRDQGTVEVRLRIDTDGSVAAANLVGGTVNGMPLAQCVTGEMAQATFPKSAEPVTLHYAIDLGTETIYRPGRYVFRSMPLGFKAY